MADRPSPFSGLGLDKALLRSTQPQSQIAPAPEQPEEATEPAPVIPQRARTRKPAPAQHQEVNLQESDTDSMIASITASYPDSNIEKIRRAVKTSGREVSFIRLTPDEKGQVADIVYNYKRRGKKTTENEVHRIALNFILSDHQANGDHSILARVIDALLA